MRKYRLLVFVVLPILILTVMNATASNRTALVIGNGAYQSTPLRNPVNDAGDMANVLFESGFKVILKINASQREMETAMRAFGKALRKGGIGLFYYAGHGLQLNGTNYLIPVDAQIETESDVKYEAVDAGRILGKMEDAGNNLNIVILDACRNNPLKRSFRDSSKGLAYMDAPDGTLIAYATKAGSVSEDGSGRNGTYTEALLKHIETPGLEIRMMFNRTGLDVEAKTGKAQKPWISNDSFPPYYLAGGITTVASPASTPVTGTGMVKILSEPMGAEIFIQGKARGRTPLEITDIAPGSYGVKAVSAGYQSEEKKVIINQGRKAVVTFYLDVEATKAKLYVTTSPLGCKVKILNIAPVFYNGIELDKGRYKLEVSKPGYDTKIQWVDIHAYQGVDFYVELTKQAAPNVLPSKAQPGDTWKDPVTGMSFVYVPGGCYQMGQTEAEKTYLIKEVGTEKYKKYYGDELPRHEVCVDGFWMGKSEVSRGQFRQFIKETGYRTDADKKGKAYILNKDTGWKWKEESGYNWEKAGYSQTDSHPVVCVSWNDAKAFIRWLSRKSGQTLVLPTEAQWEYAARGGTESMRFWGTNDADACKYANVADKGSSYSSSFPCSDGSVFTAPVGSLRANPFGLYDMLGNAWEWCEDVYDKTAYSKHNRNNPAITSGGALRVGRGGGWGSYPRSLRAARRSRDAAGGRRSHRGFRLCFPQVRQ